MCIIVLDKQGGSVTEKQIRNMFTRNGDGFGITPLDGKTRNTFKVGNPRDVDEVLELWARHKDAPYTAHLRLKTHGEIDEINCHPYALFGNDTWLYHNGILNVVPEVDRKMSDTWHLVEYFLRPIGRRLFKYLEDPNFKLSLGKMIGATNKLVFVSPNAVHIVNEGSGKWRADNNLWLSNELCVDAPKAAGTSWWETRGAYEYKPPVTTTKNTSVSKGSKREHVTPPWQVQFPFDKETLASMSLNDMAAAIRMAPKLFLDAVREILEIEVDNPTSMEEVRNLAIDCYLETVQRLHNIEE